jgi:hypothetical protein
VRPLRLPCRSGHGVMGLTAPANAA